MKKLVIGLVALAMLCLPTSLWADGHRRGRTVIQGNQTEYCVPVDRRYKFGPWVRSHYGYGHGFYGHHPYKKRVMVRRGTRHHYTGPVVIFHFCDGPGCFSFSQVR